MQHGRDRGLEFGYITFEVFVRLCNKSSILQVLDATNDAFQASLKAETLLADSPISSFLQLLMLLLLRHLILLLEFLLLGEEMLQMRKFNSSCLQVPHKFQESDLACG